MKQKHEAILWDSDTGEVTRNEFMTPLIRKATKEKITGFIITPSNEMIGLRKGKRPGVEKGTWVDADVGCKQN